MHHLYAWCSQKPEENTESPETGVTVLLVIKSSARATSALNH